MSSKFEILKVPSVFSTTSFYTCTVLLLRPLLKLLNGNMYIPISCFCMCACVCVSVFVYVASCINTQTFLKFINRTWRLYNPLEMMPLVQYDHQQSRLLSPNSSISELLNGEKERKRGGGGGRRGRFGGGGVAAGPNKELFIMIDSLHGDSSYFTGLSVA